ncbi:inosine/xanthosine triphosphatase [Thermococcus aggregans]|uniref:Probable inosine/xanthosine triphosphatase n=1 Tax=Thermococcus aggregans TaxID=110163 RepID=A0A9E7MWR1_THEAG|nr:inosine/xanthosine triphosphatase [Thermococcus aggregans]USS40247.1 inosine/xanthosine triphosphatase [Thermococcus aggregans]
MRIAVGSTNPTKVKAVENVMRKIYGEVEVFGVEVESGVSDQPVGIEEIVQGAINRAKMALEKTSADFGVGIEAGIYPFPQTLTGYLDIQVCAIASPDGVITIGHGPGFEYPPIVIERILNEGVEAGIAMGGLVNDLELKKKIGAIGVLSKGLLTRTELNEIAVLMAMIPRLNKELFFGRK